MFEFLLALGLSPIEWSEAVAWTSDGSAYIKEVLDRGFAAAHAIVVLLTADEMAYLRPQFASAEDTAMETTPNPQARPNVLFEAGMAFGRYPERTVLVTLGVTRQFSDVAGKLAVRLSDSVSDRQNLAERLKAIGSPVDFDYKMVWHTAGNFEAAIEASRETKLPASGSGSYYVIATSTGKVLDVALDGWGNRRVHQVEQLGQTNQRWRPVQTMDEYYFLFAEHSGKCLDVEASRTGDKEPVVEHQFNGTDAQRWILESADDSCFYMINKGSRKALHAVEGSDVIYQFTLNYGNSQRWRFHPV
jgi:hypothetical protein